nr:uncharacterized protein LOC104116566 [Nicotiana tomentosiformis]
MLADSFIKAHAGARKVQARKADIFRIAQGKSELLREFMIRIEGCSSKGFRSSNNFAPDRRTDHGRNNRSLQEKEVPWARNSTYPRLSNYNFSISLLELVSAIRNIKEARFPKLIQSDPSQRDLSLWREYHGTHDHRIGECRHHHEEVATLLKNGHLREFLSDRAKNNYDRSRDNTEPLKVAEGSHRLTINMIFGGNEVNYVTFSAKKKMEISVTHNKRLRKVTEDDITFTKEDADELLLPHNDALVPEEMDVTKLTTEELEQVALFEEFWRENFTWGQE